MNVCAGCRALAQVAVEWRDAYTLTCMLRADSILQSSSCGADGVTSPSSEHQPGMLPSNLASRTLADVDAAVHHSTNAHCKRNSTHTQGSQ